MRVVDGSTRWQRCPTLVDSIEIIYQSAYPWEQSVDSGVNFGPEFPPLPPTPTPAPLGSGATRVWLKDDSVMVYVPAGEFIMDSSLDERGREIGYVPQHEARKGSLPRRVRTRQSQRQSQC